MRGPNPPVIELTAAERHDLDQVGRRAPTPQQLGLRARSVLAAAAGANNSQIARPEGVEVDTVRLWRPRWVALQAVAGDDLSVAERVPEAPRPGTPARITDAQGCRIVALAWEGPERAGRPISQGTARELAEEIQQRGIVEQISARQAARRLKRGRGNRTGGDTG